MPPTEHSPRTCAIAARSGKPVPCPPGGCALGRLLDPGRADIGDPCLVEQIADSAYGNPLVLFCLDQLREELEGTRAAAGRL